MTVSKSYQEIVDLSSTPGFHMVKLENRFWHVPSELQRHFSLPPSLSLLLLVLVSLCLSPHTHTHTMNKSKKYYFIFKKSHKGGWKDHLSVVDYGLVPSTYVVTDNHLKLQFPVGQCPLLASTTPGMHTIHIHTCRPNEHKINHFFNLRNM